MNEDATTDQEPKLPELRRWASWFLPIEPPGTEDLEGLQDDLGEADYEPWDWDWDHVNRKVLALMRADCDQDKGYVRTAYEEATPEQRAVLDAAFVGLCGYRLTTILAATPPPGASDD